VKPSLAMAPTSALNDSGFSISASEEVSWKSKQKNPLNH
jgi:hypothetical protein